MPEARAKGAVAKWHRWLGWSMTVPLVAWVVSAAVMMLVSMNAPNGLAGIYSLNPYNSVDTQLEGAVVLPGELLSRLRSEFRLDRVYWLRLESRGPHLWYVVKPTPFALAMTFDARTGQRLDPLPDSLLAVVANETLVGSHVVAIESAPEYNRYYDVDRVPAVRAQVTGAQSARLVLSRDEGRTLRRLNAESQRFEWWYRLFHVNQLTDHKWIWTPILYACAVAVLLLTAFGYCLFWWRRPRGVTAGPDAPRSPHALRARLLHRRLGAIAGGILSIQLIIGAYLWLSLGPLEDPFRGKTSFRLDWASGLSTLSDVDSPKEALARLASVLPTSPRPVQALEWRSVGGQQVWVVTVRRDEPSLVFTRDGARVDSLPWMVVGEIARDEVVGRPAFTFVGSSPQLYMDLNRPIPTYQFRFADAAKTDVFVSQATGQVIQRRPQFWRVFGPFLAVHMFSVTGNKSWDMVLLVAFQIAVMGIIATGWFVRFPGESTRGAA